MGTNFYFFTRDRGVKDRWFGTCFEIVDTPDFGYKRHLAKTSCGWLPLFQGDRLMCSVSDFRRCFDESEGLVEIYDEYGERFTWEEFEERVINWNGGTAAKRKLRPCRQDPQDEYYDRNMPDHTPVSHLEYVKHDHSYADFRKFLFMDHEGYEFCMDDFS